MLFLIRTLKLNSPTNTKRNTKFAQRMSRSLPRYLPNQEVASGRISPPELARHEGSVFLCKNPPNYRETSAGNRNNRGRRGCGNWDGRQSSYNHNRDQTDSMDTKYHGREREREREIIFAKNLAAILRHAPTQYGRFGLPVAASKFFQTLTPHHFEPSGQHAAMSSCFSGGRAAATKVQGGPRNRVSSGMTACA
jgi:hypothetical protein